MYNLYYLMHKDNIVCSVSITDDGSYREHKVFDSNKEHIPLLLNRSIKSWINNRGIPKTRVNLSRDLGNQTSGKLMLANLGLSLTDCYWLKPKDSGYCWRDVSPYTNDFVDDLDLRLRDNTLNVGQTGFLPSASLSGDLQKKWVIDKNTGKRYLIKGNTTRSCVQSLCECLASEIYKRQPFKVEYTPYKMVSLKNKGVKIKGCACPIFTSEQLEFVSAADLVNGLCPKASVKTGFEIYKNILKSSGIDCDYFYDMQIIVDFIISNTDRHYNNFGVLRNPDTLDLIKPAPIYDSGNAMFYDSSYIPHTKRGLLRIKTNSFCNKELDLLQHITNTRIFDVTCLPSEQEVYNLFSKDKTLKEDIIENMVKAYIFKRDYFHKFQLERLVR